MEINFLALLVAALSSFAVGFIWYNPKVFGNIWMKESGMTEEKMKDSNMLMVFGMSFVYAFLISMQLQLITIHQWSVLSLVGMEPDKALPSYNAFMTDYADAFRTFKHGAFHGVITGLFFALPLIGTNALYERRSFKYTLVTGGYWIVSFAIMGGIICAMK